MHTTMHQLDYVWDRVLVLFSITPCRAYQNWELVFFLMILPLSRPRQTEKMSKVDLTIPHMGLSPRVEYERIQHTLGMRDTEIQKLLL